MQISFQTAYRQLQPVEKTFVDTYVEELETSAVRLGIKITTMLTAPIDLKGDPRRYEFLQRAIVRAAITERVHDIAASMELSAHKVIKEVQAIAFCSIGHYMEVGEDGQPYFNLTKCTPEQLSAIASIEIEDTHGPRGGTRKWKFKLHDKLSGLDKFMRYMGLLDPDNVHWRASERKDAGEGFKSLPASASVDVAADAYSRMING